jgi:hypothetical protein
MVLVDRRDNKTWVVVTASRGQGIVRGMSGTKKSVQRKAKVAIDTTEQMI